MSPAPFALRGEHITLEGLIKASDLAGMGSVARALIADGAVAVDGQVETRRGRKLRGGELVELAGEQLRIVASGHSA